MDGYRAVAVKSDRGVNLYSRRHKSFNHQYPHLVEALGELPNGTVVDGEVVALDETGRPDFNLLQNFRSEAQHIHYFIFDLLVYQDRDLTRLPLSDRRKLMKSHLKLRQGCIRIAEQFEASASDMLAAVRQQQLEGVIGKRKDSLYEPGKRSGSWVKCRVNRGQKLVIGGYIPGPHGFDSLIVGYYRGKDLMYVARVRNGFVPASRRQVFEKIRHLVAPTMPFTNLPDTHNPPRPTALAARPSWPTKPSSTWLLPSCRKSLSRKSKLRRQTSTCELPRWLNRTAQPQYGGHKSVTKEETSKGR